MLRTIWNTLVPWLPAAGAVGVTVVVLLLARLIISRKGTERRGVPYQRQIASVLIVLAGVFAVVILLPLESQLRTQILSVLGVLLSAVVALSSTSLVGNAMAGIVMRISKSYRPGDFIEVGDIIGRVAGQGLFHTDVQLITRDMVALPNLYLSRHPVHVTRSSGTFVSVEVSLGYETPTQQAEEALRDSVQHAGLDEPFVLVDRLLDHAIVYQVFGLLEDTSRLLTARSRLRRSIVSTLHGRGIEIVSPGFVNRVEYPTEYRFVPEQPVSPSEETEESDQTSDQVEAIAFDKAEEAESIERLYALQEKLAHEKEGLDERIKAAEDKDEKQRLKRERDEVNRRIERTGEIVERREDQADERNLEEES
ncbi:MAG: mechanosensitive ion channel domain-containing protein [bacterium]